MSMVIYLGGCLIIWLIHFCSKKASFKKIDNSLSYNRHKHSGYTCMSKLSNRKQFDTVFNTYSEIIVMKYNVNFKKIYAGILYAIKQNNKKKKPKTRYCRMSKIIIVYSIHYLINS